MNLNFLGGSNGRNICKIWYMDNGCSLDCYHLSIYDITKQKETEKTKRDVWFFKEGDEIVTIGGIKGTISSVQEDYIQIRVDKGVHLTIRKSAVAVVLK